MARTIIYILFFLIYLLDHSEAAITKNSVSLYLGMHPTFGGNLHSGIQSSELGIDNGIDGINRYAGGVDNKRIDKLTGFSVGSEFKVCMYDILVLQVGINYTKSFMGGSGTSIDMSGNSMQVGYSMWTIDVPFLVGISYPLGETVRFSLCGGLALAYGSYSNSFKSATLNSSATFSGWALPLCINMSGEYLLYKDIGLYSSISYYRGKSETIKDKSDYASIDFSGFRWQIGAIYYFTYITSKRL